MLKRKSFSVGVIRGLILFLLMTGGSIAGQGCSATGDIDCSGGIPTGLDLSGFVDYLNASFGDLACTYEADITADCVVDWRDIQRLADCLYYPPDPPEPFCVTGTCCDPLMIYSTEPHVPLGNATLSYQSGIFVVDEIGMTGNDGIRIYPNMGGVWRQWVNYILDNISLSTDGSEVKFMFTGAGGMGLEWPLIDIDSGQFLDRVVEADIVNTGGQMELSVDFLWDDISHIEVLAFDGGTASGSLTVDGNVSMMTGDLQIGALSVTEVSLSLSDSTALTMRFDRPVEFTYSNVPPVPLFTADELRFVAVNVIQPTVGVGPLDITAASLGWFGVHFSSCCVDHVGNANGQGGEEPTIGDVSVMIDAKFITGTCDGILPCLAEADINRSGGCHPTCDDITIGDIAILIDCMFISGCPPWSISSPCLVCP